MSETLVLQSSNPFSQEIIGEYSVHSKEEVDKKMILAQESFQKHSHSSPDSRSASLFHLAEALEKDKDSLAQLMTREMGKPISQSRAEIEKCAWLCRYYGENGPSFLEDEPIETDASNSFVRKAPLGVILGVMPWNFPFWQVFRFAVPAIMAGNAVVLKHASNVSGCALAIEQLFASLDFEKNVFQTLLLPSSRVGEVLGNPICHGVSLTGSSNAGASVAALAGRYLIPSLLELGGNNAFVVLEDANIDHAIDRAVQARIQNSGQSCIAAKRFLIHTSLMESFTERLVAEFELLKMGDPFKEQTQVGPLARIDLAEELERQVSESVALGARILCGGARCEAFYEPTIVSNVESHMPVWKEETFGPVAAIRSFRTENELIELVNDSDYGLGVSLCTESTDKALRLINSLNEGAVFVNEGVKSDPRLPFGGVKKSGYGRELGKEGIEAFVNKKTVYVQ